MEQVQNDLDAIQRQRQQDAQMDVDMPQDGDRQTVKLSYDEYDKIGKQLVYLVKQKERDNEQSGEMGITQKQLVEMYLNSEENNIESLTQVKEWIMKLNSVIQRLVSKENVLIVIDDAAIKEDRTLTININVDI